MLDPHPSCAVQTKNIRQCRMHFINISSYESVEIQTNSQVDLIIFIKCSSSLLFCLSRNCRYDWINERYVQVSGRGSGNKTDPFNLILTSHWHSHPHALAQLSTYVSFAIPVCLQLKQQLFDVWKVLSSIVSIRAIDR
jgi:hypothetical protein